MKLQKQTIAVALFVNTLRLSAGPLGVLMFFVSMTVVVFGSIAYSVEKGTYCPASGPCKALGEYSSELADARAGTPWSSCCDPATYPTHERGCYCRVSANGDEAEVTPFYSIFISMWWVLTTITTVGYGDFFPTTLIGRLVGAATMVLGVVGFAMPITIIGNSFEQEYGRLTAQQENIGAIDKAMGVKAKSEEEKKKDEWVQILGELQKALASGDVFQTEPTAPTPMAKAAPTPSEVCVHDPDKDEFMKSILERIQEQGYTAREFQAFIGLQ